MKKCLVIKFSPALGHNYFVDAANCNSVTGWFRNVLNFSFLLITKVRSGFCCCYDDPGNYHDFIGHCFDPIFNVKLTKRLQSSKEVAFKMCFVCFFHCYVKNYTENRSKTHYKLQGRFWPEFYMLVWEKT